MRKLLLTTAAVAAAIAGAVAGETDFGTFTDTRDGQMYKTVIMPDGMTWMAQNLNYKTPSGSWCYNDSTSYCKKYGRLYDWKTAKTVCPTGWKLPDTADWNRLAQTVGGKRLRECDEESSYWWEGAGKKLKSKSGWEKNGNGTDDYGFLALPGGFRLSDGFFGNAGYDGYWWTATENNSGLACLRYMGYYNDAVYENYYLKSDGYSVRCVADRP